MPQNGITHPGVTALATAIQHNTGLRVLNLNDNTFTEKGAIAMAQVLRHSSVKCHVCQHEVKVVDSEMLRNRNTKECNK